MEDPKLILEICAFGATLIAQAALGIWALSAAWSRLRSHDARIDKLEERSEEHGKTLRDLILDVSVKLEHLQTSLSSLAGERLGRRASDRNP